MTVLGAVCRRAFLAALVVADAATAASAARAAFSVEDWGPRSGLAPGSVRSITQTPDGYLWLLTSQGPCKFDGVRFTPSAELIGAIGDRVLKVRAMKRALDGGLWFGGPDFVVKLEGGRTRLFERALDVHRLADSSDGSLWIAHEEAGVTRLWQGRFESRLSPPVIFSALHEDAAGRLWAGSWGHGLFQLEQDRLVPAGRHADGYVNDLGSDASGTLWAATRAGLYALEGDRARRLLEASNVTAMGPSSEGGLWVGTSGGSLYHVHAGASPRLEPVGARAPNQVLAVFEDREGSLWIGHPDGLRRAKPGPFVSYGEQPWLAHNPALSILEAADGAIWVFSDGGGLSRIKDGAITRLTTRDGLASDYGGPLFESRDGTLWVGTARGLTRIRNGAVTSYTTGLLSGAVSALFEDEEGLVVAPEFNGLHRFRHGRLTPYRVAGYERFQSYYIYQAHRSKDGIVWLATNNGLVSIRNGEARIFNAADGLLEDNVRGVHEDTDGALWIATAKIGIARLAAGKLLTITTRQGLHDDRVYSVLPGGDGHLWMSSARGLFRVSRDDIESVAAGKAARVRSIVYDIADGLLTTDFAPGAQPPAWKSHDGRLWFGTQKGVVAVDTARISQNLLPPPVVIEGVSLDGREVPARAPVVVAPGVRRVELHFTGLSLLAPHRVLFRYRLEGSDADWLEDHRRSASYMNLRPGPYTFRVTASNNDGVWNDTAASLRLDVQPFFYQTALFRWILAGAALAAALAVHRWRVAGVHRRYEAVIEERTRIAREMHDTLAQNLGGLALLLDSIKAQHRHLSSALADQLEETSRLLRYNLAEVYRAIRDLRTSDRDRRGLLGAVTAILERATKGSGTRFRVRGEVGEPSLPPRVRDELLRILQEAAANAARHAGAQTVEVELHHSEGRVRLTVSDDGCGFDTTHAFLLEAGHYGLIGIRERAKRIGGRLEIASVVGKGTQVSVEVPAP